MRLRTLITAVVVTAGLVVAAPAIAQAPASQESAQTLQQELSGIQQRLAALEAQAMQDPAIAKDARQLDTDVQKALEKADPKFDDKIARLEELVKELEAKVQAQAPEGDLMPLVAEGQAIQRDIQNTQAQVLQSEPLSSRVGKLHAKIQEKMAELDPEAPKLLKRAETIVQQLQSQSGTKPGA